MSKKKTQIPSLDKFKFLQDKVLIRAIRADETTSGLVNPEQYEDKPEFGIVVSAGPGKFLESGAFVDTRVKVGDMVFFEKYLSVQTRINGEDFYIVREDDISAIYEKR